MNKHYLLLTVVLTCLTTLLGYSQTYSEYASTPSGDGYNTLVYSDDTLTFTFNGLPGTSYTDATLTLEGSAAIYPGGGYKILGPGMITIDTIIPTMYTCLAFTESITIPLSDLIALGDTVVLNLVTFGPVYPYCVDMRHRMRLTYNYCATGTPSVFADITNSDVVFCRSEGTVALTATPVGGVFTGPGISGNTLELDALPGGYGQYWIYYTNTEANGCYTQDSIQYSVLENPADVNLTVCKNAPELNSDITSIYASDLGLMNPFGTGTNVTLPPISVSPTTIYGAQISNQYLYQINALDTTNYQIVNHDALSGDDRGGIAVSENYVYVVGDDATARYDLNLQNGVDLMRRDGLFTDLAKLKLYTLYNTDNSSTPNYEITTGFTVNSIRSLTEDLALGNEIIMLTQPIEFGLLGEGIILAGYNELILGDGYTGEEFYHISLINGQVTSLGNHTLTPYGSENWADWGMTGFDGTDYHAYYRSDDDSLVDYNFTTGLQTSIIDITDFSDMSSIIAHPVNHRFYGHFEGSSNIFGGLEENLFYFQLSDTSAILPATPQDYACPFEMHLSFNSIDLGPDTTICSEDGLYLLSGGFGYSSYTWNGVNNNFNAFPVETSGTVVLSVVDEINCTLTDSINISITECTAGLNELDESAMSIYPVPNHGQFEVNIHAQNTDATLVVVDMQGKVVGQTTLAAGSTHAAMNLQVEPGIYIVSLVTANGQMRKSIVIQ